MKEAERAGLERAIEILKEDLLMHYEYEGRSEQVGMRLAVQLLEQDLSEKED